MLSLRPAPSLRELTTLGLGGRAFAELSFSEEKDLEEAGRRIDETGLPVCAIGAGSNILAADGELPLLLVRPRCMDDAEIAGEEKETGKVIVRAGAGVRLSRLLARCASWGLTGLEGLVGVPGTVGGAVAMNAGSYGCGSAALLHGLRVWSPDAGLEDAHKGAWNFAYRYFELTKKPAYFFILSASFSLTPASSNGIRESMRLNYFKKKSTQPLFARSAGCAFKNPSPSLAAGKLLDEAGFRGKRLGGMAFSSLHANFLINEGKGSSQAAFDLLAEARDAVRRRSGIELETEIRLLPCP
jgi:UDP-N-acetylmuramate dehydrogenase